MSLFIPNAGAATMLVLTLASLILGGLSLNGIRNDPGLQGSAEIRRGEVYTTYSVTLQVYTFHLIAIALFAHYYSVDCRFLVLWYILIGVLAFVSGLLYVLAGIAYTTTPRSQSLQNATTLREVYLAGGLTLLVAFFAFVVAYIHYARPTTRCLITADGN